MKSDHEFLAALKKSPIAADLQRANDEVKLAERKALVEKFEAERATAEKEIARLEKLADAAAERWRKAEEIATKARTEAVNANAEFLAAKRNLDFAEDRLEHALAQGGNPLIAEFGVWLRDEYERTLKTTPYFDMRERDEHQKNGFVLRVKEGRNNKASIHARSRAILELANSAREEWPLLLDQSDDAINAKISEAKAALPKIEGLPEWPL